METPCEEDGRKVLHMFRTPSSSGDGATPRSCPSSNSPALHVFKTPKSTLIIHSSPRVNRNNFKTPSKFSTCKTPLGIKLVLEVLRENLMCSLRDN